MNEDVRKCLASAAEAEIESWKREYRLINAAHLKAEERVKELEARIKDLDYDDEVRCALRMIKRLEGEVASLTAERDADRKREYGYSQQTVDALTAERDAGKLKINDLEAEVARLTAIVTR